MYNPEIEREQNQLEQLVELVDKSRVIYPEQEINEDQETGTASDHDRRLSGLLPLEQHGLADADRLRYLEII